jgi:hypothetical protein
MPLAPGVSPAARGSVGRRHRSLLSLAVSLARHPEIATFARDLAGRWARGGRTGRIVASFTFVSHLVDAPPAPEGDGVSWLLERLGPQRGPAVLLAAVLLALGERAQVESTREISFVRVELEPADLLDLPPHAELLVANGRTYLPLDPRRHESPLGVLPPGVRAVLARRRSARQRPYWRSLRSGVPAA